jgi:hypothetical protein
MTMRGVATDLPRPIFGSAAACFVWSALNCQTFQPQRIAMSRMYRSVNLRV